MKTIHIFGRGRPYTGHDMEERLRAQHLRGAQNDVRWGPDHPPLIVILRGPTAKSVQRAHNS